MCKVKGHFQLDSHNNFIGYIHQNLVNVSNYKDNNFQEMLESFKHLNEKFHGEMRSGLIIACTTRGRRLTAVEGNGVMLYVSTQFLK